MKGTTVDNSYEGCRCAPQVTPEILPPWREAGGFFKIEACQEKRGATPEGPPQNKQQGETLEPHRASRRWRA